MCLDGKLMLRLEILQGEFLSNSETNIPLSVPSPSTQVFGNTHGTKFCQSCVNPGIAFGPVKTAIVL